MGSAASKHQRVLNQTKVAARTPLVQPNRQQPPKLEPLKTKTEHLRPDGHDPQELEGGHHRLLEHLSKMEPVNVQNQRESYQPASQDHMSRTLEARQHHESVDPIAASKTSGKTLLPGQTITAIVRMMQRGEPRDQIIQTFQIDPQVLDKLQILTIPTAPGPQGGVGIRRSK